MELIIEKIKHLGWELEEVGEIGVTVYRFVKEDGALSLYLGLKDSNMFIDVAGKRIGFRINVSPKHNAIELYAYAMRRYHYSEVENATKQLLEELVLLSSEALSVAKAVLNINKEV